MAGRHLNKMTTLTPDTHKIASDMKNFSGWLRARLRQFDEGVDLVELEMAKEYLKMQFRAVSRAINELEAVDEVQAEAIWLRYNEIISQKTLGDFE